MYGDILNEIVPVELIYFCRNSSSKKKFRRKCILLFLWNCTLLQNWEKKEKEKERENERINSLIFHFFCHNYKLKTKQKEIIISKVSIDFFIFNSFQLRQIVNWFLSKNKLMHAKTLLPSRDGVDSVRFDSKKMRTDPIG